MNPARSFTSPLRHATMFLRHFMVKGFPMTTAVVLLGMFVGFQGPAVADVMENSAYVGSKTTLKMSPSGCHRKGKAKSLDTVLGFGEAGPFYGEWGMTLFSSDIELVLFGPYIERKPNKELTMGLDAESLDEVISFIDYYVEINCNGEVTDAQRGAYEVSRGQGKLSKDGGKIKVSIEVKGKYTKNKGKTDNIKFKLDGKTNFDPDAQNPLFPAAEPL